MRRRLVSGHNEESFMDAKYNWLIDNPAIRVTLNTAAFALWIALAIGIMELAARA
jgi:high-affinity nickel permease